MLEDLAAKVEDLEAAVREKESTKKALRDAFSQVAGTHHTPIARKTTLQRGRDAVLQVASPGYLLLLLPCHMQPCRCKPIG